MSTTPLRSKIIRLAASFPKGSGEREALLNVLANSAPRWVADLAEAAKLHSPLASAKFDGSTLWLIYPNGVMTEGFDGSALYSTLRDVARRHRLSIDDPWNAVAVVSSPSLTVTVQAASSGKGQVIL